MPGTKVVRNDGGQGVVLAKTVAFPESVREVVILRDGDRSVIVRADRVWDDFFEAPGFDIGERDQPEAQVREIL